MNSFMELALSNKKNDRWKNVNDVFKKTFKYFSHEEYQFVSKLKSVLVYGSKKERIETAKELQKIADLFNENNLFLTKNEDFEPGTFEEIIAKCGYESKEEYIELVNKSIEDLYKKEIFHYSDFITNSKDLKPLSEVNSYSSTTDTNFRIKTEKELDIVDCLYATVNHDLEKFYGKNKLIIDKSDYDILYHLGDTLENAKSNYYYCQKPFKEGEFDIYKNKFIPKKKDLLENGASSLIFNTVFYGRQVIEVILMKKEV